MSVLKIGIIGAGGIARGHGNRIQEHPDAEIAAITEPSAAALAAFKESVYPDAELPPVYKNHKDMLANATLDGVLIASPHTLHFPQIMDCLDNGLHVLSEKPMACSETEATQIIAKAADTGRYIVVSYQRRFNRQYRFMKDFIQTKAFGKRNYIAAFLSQGWLKSQTGTWRQDPALSGGGQLNDSGSHVVDMITWMLEDPIEQVTALIDNRGTQVDIDSAIAFRTRGGTLGTLSLLGSGPTNAFWEDMTVAGEHGHSLFYRGGKLMATHGHGKDLVDVTDFGGHTDSDPDTHFIEVIQGKAKNESPPDSFLDVIRFTEACWTSAKQGGQPVTIG